MVHTPFINEGFHCVSCGFEVPPARHTCRNHCTSCLTSLHVDMIPGDRAATCHGLLRPIGAYLHGKKGWMIEHLCDTCGASRVITSREDDNQELLASLSHARNMRMLKKL